MRTGATLDPGFYWVSVDALPPEVARRDAEAGEWVLIGQESGSGIADGGERVAMLSGPLAPPPAGAARRAQKMKVTCERNCQVEPNSGRSTL
jgi:hypothetical protein